MLTTAKSIQLLDASGLNISPITDITSLYYEKTVNYSQDDKNTSIVTRKYVYAGFPLAVNISTYVDEPSMTPSIVNDTRTPNLWNKNTGQLYKLQNEKREDIIISNVSTSILPGTTYRQLNVINYNLSDILSHYTPLNLIDASIEQLNSSIIYTNNYIADISSRITDISAGLYPDIMTLYDLMALSGKTGEQLASLVPNKFYLINDYYGKNSGGCMKLPDEGNFAGPDASNSLLLLVKANDASTLDGKLYNMYDNSGKSLDVYGTYKLLNEDTDSPLIQITQLKDKYGNEAYYDLYNLKYNSNLTFSNNQFNLIHNKKIYNNIIKTNPYDIGVMPYIIATDHSNTLVCNNYIGYDTKIYVNIGIGESLIKFSNNIILNNCSIGINVKGIISINNTIIENNNIIEYINNSDNASISYDNINIYNDNNIKIETATTIKNLNINSSNNLTLYNYGSNVTILNNCNASINLSDNIIVDNASIASNSSLNTTPNSVYLFKQDVYAKSFNTLNS